MQPEEQLRQCDPADPAFESQAPFPLDPAAFFAATEAALEFTEIGTELNFDQLLNGIVLTED